MSERAARERYGRHAETVAAWWLRLCGYRILARRFRGPIGEIDLVARRGRLLVFVEVKARSELGPALESLTPHQCRRITRAAEAFVKRHPQYRDLDQRFDVIAIGRLGRPRHLPDAWRPMEGSTRWHLR